MFDCYVKSWIDALTYVLIGFVTGMAMQAVDNITTVERVKESIVLSPDISRRHWWLWLELTQMLFGCCSCV